MKRANLVLFLGSPPLFWRINFSLVFVSSCYHNYFILFLLSRVPATRAAAYCGCDSLHLLRVTCLLLQILLPLLCHLRTRKAEKADKATKNVWLKLQRVRTA